MSKDYFSDAEVYTAQALPTPSDTPYHTPVQRSRQSSRFGTPSSGHPPSPPPPLPPDIDYFWKDTIVNGDLPITDPRRFTPTLHASLVAEILSLRRDLETKNKLVDGLEESLHGARAESEELNRTLSDRVKETRILKKQLQHVEGGTASALQELSNERDEVNEVNADLRKRLDASQKKLRDYEEDAEHSQTEWDRERHIWEEDRRLLERRIHVCEGRLKAVVDEVAAQQMAHDQAIGAQLESLADENGDGHEFDRASLRSMGRKSRKHARNSSASTIRSARSIRYSVYSDAQAKPNGMSLADELHSDGEDGYDPYDLERDDDSDRDVRTKRARESRQFPYQDGKAKRVLGIMLDAKELFNNAIRPSTPRSPTKYRRSDELTNSKRPSLDEPIEFGMRSRRPLSQHSENGPRSSLQSSPQKATNRSRLLPVLEHGILFPTDQDGNKDIDFDHQTICSVCGGSRRTETIPPQLLLPMVSSSSQTDRESFSPPSSTRTSQDEMSMGSDTTIVKCDTVSASVQTEPVHIFHVDSLSQSPPQRRPLPSIPPKPAYQAKVDRYSMSELIGIWESGSPVKSRSASPEYERAPAGVSGRFQNLALGTKSDLMSTGVQTEPLSAAYLLQALQQGEGEATNLQLTSVAQKPITSSTSTQTEAAAPDAPNGPPSSTQRGSALLSLSIPLIAIHPPLSSPPSPVEAVLPPRTRNAACQVSYSFGFATRSASVQTEEIRIDKRAYVLPSVLPSSKASSRPLVPREEQLLKSGTHDSLNVSPERRQFFGLSASPMKLDDTSIVDTYVYSDNATLSQDNAHGQKRPSRLANMLPRFEDLVSDENEELDEADVSDGETITPIATARQTWMFRHGKPFKTFPTPVPEDKEVASSSYRDGETETSERSFSRQSSGRGSIDSRSPDRPPRVVKQLRLINGHKGPSIRRAALIQSGTAAHLEQHSRTPSLASDTSSKASSAHPPFPVPMRLSSWRVPAKTGRSSRSEGSKTPTPRGGSNSPKKRQTGNRSPGKKDNLRKVRSATVMPRKSRRQGSTSPPPVPRSPVSVARVIQIPPLPKEAASSKYMVTLQEPKCEPRPTTGQLPPGNASVDASGSTTVVDAIAATMVGEWMWKYVRRRTSFGVTESPQDTAKAREQGSPNGSRHKRWVWLSPYERAVMWSSKQPTSETALMGKSGRKLTIQSVLDVVDNNPLPRNTQGTQLPFNRSILILTPTRALKFTAFTRERHYMWLTALSFLAHSYDGDGVDGNPAFGVAAANLSPLSSPPDASKAKTAMNSLRKGNKARNSLREAFSPSSSNPIDKQHLFLAESQNIDDAADAPTIPRYNKPMHTRKRSMTGPRIVPQPMQAMSIRSFSTGLSPNLNTSADFYNIGFGIEGGSIPDGAGSLLNGSGSGGSAAVMGPAGGVASRRTSVTASSTTGGGGGRLSPLPGAGSISMAGGSNFFEALGTVGTVRMEAFVKNGSDGPTPRRSGSSAPSRAGSRRGLAMHPPGPSEDGAPPVPTTRSRLGSFASITTAATSVSGQSKVTENADHGPLSSSSAAMAAPTRTPSQSAATGASEGATTGGGTKSLRPGVVRGRGSLGRAGSAANNTNRISGGIWEDVELEVPDITALGK